MNEQIRVEPTTTLVAPARVRRVSWGAIFAGMVVTIGIQIMFTLLGAAIGISSLQGSQQNPAQTIATASGIWLLVTGLISMWIGACVAGRLSGGPLRADGLLHGVVTWSLSTITMFALLATSVGAVLGGTAAFVGGALTSQAGGEQSGGFAALESSLKGSLPQTGALLPPTGRTSNESAPGNLTALAQQDTDLAAALSRLESNGGAAKATKDRDQVLNILTTRHDLSQEDATNLLNQWDQQYQKAHSELSQKAGQAGQTAAHTIQQGTLWAFVALILGLIVAAWGGWTGTASLPEPVEVV